MNSHTKWIWSVLIVLCTAIGCDTKEAEPVTCDVLFGMPSENTGLSADQCAPQCECGDHPWTPLTYEEQDFQALEEWILTNPPPLLTADPYATPDEVDVDQEAYCAVLLNPETKEYSLQQFEQEDQARELAGKITHKGPCGQCSSLQNLAVYMRNPDLTEPVRSCGLKGVFEGQEANIECLMEIGFDEACAQIWYFNTQHTRESCLEVCMENLESPHHLSDGQLNPCIQCDEDESGPIFKAVSGRTRRNSGLPSGLCRPCESVYRVDHQYP